MVEGTLMTDLTKHHQQEDRMTEAQRVEKAASETASLRGATFALDPKKLESIRMTKKPSGSITYAECRGMPGGTGFVLACVLAGFLIGMILS